jgi:DNA-directed RNA polymerase specialized sigma24 family protein
VQQPTSQSPSTETNRPFNGLHSDDESPSFKVTYKYLIPYFAPMTPERCTSQLRSSTMAPLLSPRKRGKIVAHVLDGKTYGEIAQKYNIAKGTVAYTMQRERLHNTQKLLPTGRRPHKMTERSK